MDQYLSYLEAEMQIQMYIYSIFNFVWCTYLPKLPWKSLENLNNLLESFFNWILNPINPLQTRLHKSRSSRDELEFDLSNFV